MYRLVAMLAMSALGWVGWVTIVAAIILTIRGQDKLKLLGRKQTVAVPVGLSEDRLGKAIENCVVDVPARFGPSLLRCRLGPSPINRGDV